MWHHFLAQASYPESLFFISKEAANIANFLITGLYGLIVVYRDDYSYDKPFPLLPWLHLTEACEHTFGEARKIIPDFTVADFYHILGKISIKVHEAVLLAEASADPQKRAGGYNHTYMDYREVDLLTLASYPSDPKIICISKVSFDGAESLVNLLGVVPGQLHSQGLTVLKHPLLLGPEDESLVEDLEGDEELLDVFEEEEDKSDVSIL